MKLNAVAVASSDIPTTVKFYELLGFTFPSYDSKESHLESLTTPGETKLMIDTKDFMQEMLGYEPKVANHSMFALEYSNSAEVNAIVASLEAQNFIIFKQPWDAFWGQRYAVVQDPDGYLVDLYAKL